jgi:hypothetical protein
MDELQDAIEDATYVNAISGQGEGPRPMVPWIMPGEEELAEWKQMVREREAEEDKKAFSMEWTLSSALGLFLFSAFLKDNCQDHVRINFVEAVNRWRKLQGQQNNDQALQIAQTYLFENEPNSETGLLKLPAKTEIGESDLACLSSNLGIPIAELQELVEQNYDPASTKCCLAMDGPERDQVIATVEATSTSESMDSSAVIPHTALPGHLFDRVEAIILESLRKDFWTRFKRSNEYARLMMFMWYQDKKVVEDDFYVMRVLGRGGFGLVTGTFLLFTLATLEYSHRVKREACHGAALRCKSFFCRFSPTMHFFLLSILLISRGIRTKPARKAHQENFLR